MKNFIAGIFVIFCLFTITNAYPPPPPSHKAMGYLPMPGSGDRDRNNQQSSSYQSTPDYPYHNGYPDNSYETAEHRGQQQQQQSSGDGVEIRCNIIRPSGADQHRRPDDRGSSNSSDRRPSDDCNRKPDDCNDYNRRPTDDYNSNRRPDDYNNQRPADDYNKQRPDDYNRRPDDYSQMRNMREF